MRPNFRSALVALPLLYVLSAVVAAQDRGCTADREGRMVCAPADSSCVQNADGAVLCSTPGGGIQLDRYGTALCGPGYCTIDQDGRVFCSVTPRGAASTDRDGKAVCSGSCVAANAATCVRPKKADD